MEFAKDNEFVADFVKRTKDNIQHGYHPHEITQLINSLIGLLILPKERYYENIRNDMISRHLLNNLRQGIETPIVRQHNLKYIVRRMRNAVAHFNIECMVDNSTHQIDHIIFRDFDDENTSINPDFQITLHHEELEEFVFQFSEAVAQCMASITADAQK